MVEQRLTQRYRSDPGDLDCNLRTELQFTQDLIHQLGIVLRNDATRISSLIGDLRIRNGKGHVQRLFAGGLASQRALVHDWSEKRILP